MVCDRPLTLGHVYGHRNVVKLGGGHPVKTAHHLVKLNHLEPDVGENVVRTRGAFKICANALFVLARAACYSHIAVMPSHHTACARS